MQYAGRVVLGLLQNANDRAERVAGDLGPDVLVRLDCDTLIVANNGTPRTVDPNSSYGCIRSAGEDRSEKILAGSRGVLLG